MREGGNECTLRRERERERSAVRSSAMPGLITRGSRSEQRCHGSNLSPADGDPSPQSNHTPQPASAPSVPDLYESRRPDTNSFHKVQDTPATPENSRELL